MCTHTVGYSHESELSWDGETSLANARGSIFTMSTPKFCNFLSEVGIHVDLARLLEEDIDGEAFMELNEDDMKELGKFAGIM